MAITYEEVFQWRDICEFMDRVPGATYSADYLIANVPGCEALVMPDRARRKELWDKYEIQLIYWRKYRKDEGWMLRTNWELQIDFLERVVILGQDPNKLPRVWRQKLKAQQEAKQRVELERQLRVKLNTIEQSLNFIELDIVRDDSFYHLDNEIGQYLCKAHCQRISKCCREARDLWFQVREPDPRAAVLGGKQPQPRSDDAVLGGQR